MVTTYDSYKCAAADTNEAILIPFQQQPFRAGPPGVPTDLLTRGTPRGPGHQRFEAVESTLNGRLRRSERKPHVGSEA